MTGRRMNVSERFMIARPLSPRARCRRLHSLVDTHLAPGSHGDLTVDDYALSGFEPLLNHNQITLALPNLHWPGLRSRVLFHNVYDGPFAESCGVAAGTSTAPGIMARISLTFTKRPGHSRWLPLGIVARSKTVPLLLCTALSRT